MEKYDLENNFIRLIVDDISDSKTIEIRKNITENQNVGSLEIQQSSKKKTIEQQLLFAIFPIKAQMAKLFL